jgi:hypothetical protein
MVCRHAEPHTSVRERILFLGNFFQEPSFNDGNFRQYAKPRLTFPIQYTADPENQVANQLRLAPT